MSKRASTTYRNENKRPFKKSKAMPSSSIVSVKSFQKKSAYAAIKSIELQYYDTFLDFTAISNPGNCIGGVLDPSATSMITTPAQGDGPTNRTGKEIVCDYVEIRFTLRINGAEAVVDPPGNCNFYVALVLDRQTNGVQPVSQDMFTNPSGNNAQALNIFRNLNNSKRFKILKQEWVEMPIQALTQSGANNFSWPQQEKSFQWFVPLKALKINFGSTTTSTVVAVVDNCIHPVAFQSSQTLSGFLNYAARLRFLG